MALAPTAPGVYVTGRTHPAEKKSIFFTASEYELLIQLSYEYKLPIGSFIIQLARDHRRNPSLGIR